MWSVLYLDAINLSIESGGRIAGYITKRYGEEFEGFESEDVEQADNTYIYHLLALDDAVEQGSDLQVSDIESESDRESETESSDDDDIVLADYNRWTENSRDINVPAFSGPQPGPTQTLEADKNELDFLNLLFPRGVILEDFQGNKRLFSTLHQG